METMVLGLTLFFAAHLFPSATKARALTIAKLGEKRYKGVVALLSLAGLALVVVGKGKAGFVPVWDPASWSYIVTNVSMMLALFCLVAFRMNSNLKRFTAHPMLWGIVFWSGGHLASNGDRASIALFGSFLIYALVAMYSANLRGAAPSGQKIALRYDAMVLVSAAVAYVVLANLHPWFAGVTLVR